MKLLFFTPYYLPYVSGITVYPQLLLGELARRHQITVLTFRHDPALPAEEVREGIRILRLPHACRLSKGFLSPQSIPLFLRHLRKHDQVLMNLPNVEGLPLAIACRLARKPLTAIFHCQVDLRGGFADRFISRIVRAATRAHLRLARRITAYTTDYVNSLNWPDNLRNKTVFTPPPVLRHPVDPDYANELANRKGQARWIGFAGRIAREKGVEHLIAAVNQLPGRDQVALVFAGPFGADVAGEADYYRRISELLEKHRIAHHFAGTLHGGRLGAFYKAIDLLVLPSTNQTEAFGMVQIEAMKHGVPVVASDLPGVRMPVRLTGMGLVVPPADPRALAGAIRQIMNNKAAFTDDAKRRRADELCSPDQLAEAYEHILAELARS